MQIKKPFSKKSKAALITAMRAYKQEIEVLRSTLKQCAAKFDEYARLHLAKNTPEGNSKAIINQGYAKMIMNVLEDTN